MDDSDSKFVRVKNFKDKKRAFQEVWDLAKGKTICQASVEGDDDGKTKKHNHGGCGQRQPVFRTDALHLNAHFKATKDENGPVEARTVEMTPEKVLSIFRAISDQDCIDMGLSPEWARPEWMIITSLAVPPPSTPSLPPPRLQDGWYGSW